MIGLRRSSAIKSSERRHLVRRLDGRAQFGGGWCRCSWKDEGSEQSSGALLPSLVHPEFQRDEGDRKRLVRLWA